jgi:hypothetical protein
MNDTIHALKLRIRSHTRSRKARSARFPAPVREAAVNLARSRAHAGIPIHCTAQELGMRPATLYLWVSRQRVRRLRPVAVTANAGSTPTPPGATLVTPHGFRVEGLDAAGLSALLRALS